MTLTRSPARRQPKLFAMAALSIACLLASGCSDDDDDSTADTGADTDIESGVVTDTEDSTETETETGDISGSALGFVTDALVADPSIVDCTLGDGTETTCYQIDIAGVPADAGVGPFCPPSINSTAAEGGIWQDGTGTVYEADGDFILNLPNLYGSTYTGSDWILYDVDTGLVNITDTQDACEAAARPDVDPAYQNYCVECSLDYVEGGVPRSFLIPVTPIPADTIGQLSTSAGISLNGVMLAAPAPVEDILSNFTIAAFDDCGGHVNPEDGYHYHAATGCTEASSGGFEEDGHAAKLGYAMDGYAIYGQLDSDGAEADGLDQCRGQTDDTRGYHYHAAGPGDNSFISCFTGKTTASNDTPPGGGPGGVPPE